MAELSVRALKTFVAIVETQSYNTAGQLVHASMSTMTRHIESIEHIVGHPILHRYGKTRTPTSFGAQVYRHAKQLIAAHEQFMDEVSFLEERDEPLSVFDNSVPKNLHEHIYSH